MNHSETSACPWHRRMMAGEGRGWAAPLRAGLWIASGLYGAVVRLRNRYYDANPTRVRRLPVPVISVGNITTGGTGKTPLVIELVRRLQLRGRRPAVVSRGYAAPPQRTADELLLVRRRFPDIMAVAEADRVLGGRQAVEQGADVIVLDDAFQHRRLQRDLNILVIDATCPFGYGQLLPRGLLREPLGGLARADLVVLTRADAVSAERLEEIRATLRLYQSQAPILTSHHHPTHLEDLGGDCSGMERLRHQPVLGVAAVGNPDAFFSTVAGLKATIVQRLILPDHSRYGRRTYTRLLRMAQAYPSAAYVVTTEKDLVKLDPALWSDFALPIVAVVVDLRLSPESSATLDAALDRVIASDLDP